MATRFRRAVGASDARCLCGSPGGARIGVSRADATRIWDAIGRDGLMRVSRLSGLTSKRAETIQIGIGMANLGWRILELPDGEFYGIQDTNLELSNYQAA